MRIGLDLHNSDGVPQGTRTLMLDLARDLTRVANDVQVVAFTGTRGRAERDVARLPEAVQVRPLAHPHGVRRLLIDLPRALSAAKPDVAYVLNFVPLHGRTPVVVNIADVLFLDHPEWFDARFLRYAVPLTHWAVRRAQHVITISEQSADALQRHFRLPPDHVSVVYCGAAQGNAPVAGVPGPAGVPSRYMLAVGRFDERKNIPRLLDACERVVAAGREDFHLVLVGSHEGRWPELEMRIEKATAARWLTVERRIPNERLAALYASSDGLVFPSLGEGFGLPILEAFRARKSGVLSDIPVFREIADDAALFADPTSVEALSDALGRYWDDEALRLRLSARADERLSKFDGLASALQTLKILRRFAL